jgi:hypothetical protein
MLRSVVSQHLLLLNIGVNQLRITLPDVSFVVMVVVVAAAAVAVAVVVILVNSGFIGASGAEAVHTCSS